MLNNFTKQKTNKSISEILIAHAALSMPKILTVLNNITIATVPDTTTAPKKKRCLSKFTNPTKPNR